MSVPVIKTMRRIDRAAPILSHAIQPVKPPNARPGSAVGSEITGTVCVTAYRKPYECLAGLALLIAGEALANRGLA